MSKEKYGFVYIWYDTKKKRYYVGSHWGTEDDGYICSSGWMKQAYYRRPETFKRRILKRIFTTQTEMYENEQHYLNMIKPEEISTKYYNLHTKAKGWNWHETDNGKKKVIENRKKVYAKRTPEQKAQIAKNISEAKRKKFEDPEYRRNYAENRTFDGNKGNKHTQEWKDNNSKLHKKHWVDHPERREAASQRMRLNNPKHINSL